MVEAALASGSLITARSAAEQGREVFAVPGSIHSPLSRRAATRSSSRARSWSSQREDVLGELGGFRASGFASTVQPDDAARASAEGAGLLEHMGHDPVDIDALCVRAGMSAEQVSSELLRLELAGRVAALPGGLFQRLESAADR